jgi:molecular chaperone HscB
MNYFALFELPEQFDIDIDVLNQRFRALQSLTHPDRFAGASEQEKRMYMQKNAQINDAYYILSDQISRGEHLIELRDTQLPGEQETIGDTAFLMEQMELREELASANSAAAYEQLSRTISDMTADYVDRVNLLLTQNTQQANHEAGVELSKMKFMRKLAIETKESARKMLD